jgi:hypothetical protein
MNIDNSGILYKQARRQAIWAAVWLVVALISVIVRKDAEGSQQWLIDQLIVLSGLLMFFQFGRMFQGLALLRMNLSAGVPRIFGRGSEDGPSLPAQLDPDITPMDPRRVSATREIRFFASLEEAESYGWQFGVTEATFGDQPVPRTATLHGVSYKYDGLAPERLLGSVPLNKRVFGRLLYLQIEPSIEPTDTTAIPSV